MNHRKAKNRVLCGYNICFEVQFVLLYNYHHDFGTQNEKV